MHIRTMHAGLYVFLQTQKARKRCKASARHVDGGNLPSGYLRSSAKDMVQLLAAFDLVLFMLS
jgi:hypothetical protein